MRFTIAQYDAAIQALTDAKQQLEPDGNHCAICGDSGHQAWECGHNPLRAVAMCQTIAKSSSDLHDQLHRLAGYDFHMGVHLGPASVIMPEPTAVAETARLEKAAEDLRTAAGLVDSAADNVPVIGDAELHCLRLDLRKIGKSLLRCAETATDRRSEGA